MVGGLQHFKINSLQAMFRTKNDHIAGSFTQAAHHLRRVSIFVDFLDQPCAKQRNADSWPERTLERFVIKVSERSERPQQYGRDRKSTCLNSSHYCASRMPSSAYNTTNRTADK